MVEAVNSAITDCEQLVIDQYSDYLLTYIDYDIVPDQTIITLPDDIYQMRLRWFQYKRDGFDNTRINTAESYKIRKMPFEDLQYLSVRDPYRYRIMNHRTTGPQLEIFPAIRAEDQGTSKFRLWYVRHFKRLYNNADVTDVPVPEYLLAHLRVAIMTKEGNPMLDLALAELQGQQRRLETTLKFLSDDDEDSRLEPNLDVLEEFGDNASFAIVRA